MTEVLVQAANKIVCENDFVDSIYLIYEGKAEVTRRAHSETNTEQTVISILNPGDSIGLSTSGFFSPNGIRTATVTALTDMMLLRLDINSFRSYIQNHPRFDTKVMELTQLMLKLDFIKQIMPFSHLSNQEIHDLSLEITPITFPADTVILRQGEEANCCYLLTSGKIEVYQTDESNEKKVLAVFDKPQLFGEAAFFTSRKRNASVRTLIKSEFLIVENPVFLKLLKTSKSFAQSLMGFMVNRFIPKKNETVTVHKRTTKTNLEIITLFNSETNRYYDLNEHSWFVWQQLDGVQTIHDITLNFFKKYGALIPEIICQLLYNLAEDGFVLIPNITTPLISEVIQEQTKPSFFDYLKKLSQKKFLFTETDPWISKIYEKNISWLYTKFMKIFLILFVVISFIIFLKSISLNIHKLSLVNFWIFVVIMLPLSFFTVLLHEAGHAFTAKYFGYKVHRVGVGLVNFAPVAFTDTTQLWLAPPEIRVYVDFAGVYVDFISAGILAVIAYILQDSILSVYFWLFSFFTYVNLYKNMSPINEYDGYYILSDLLDSPRLRKDSIIWAARFLGVKDLPPQHYNMPQLIYWICYLVYIIGSAFLIFILFQIVFKIFALHTLFGLQTIYISIAIAGFMIISALFELFATLRSFTKRN